MEQSKLERLKQLFAAWSGHYPDQVELIPPSGSYRSYCRMKAGNQSAMGAWNADFKENTAFISFTHRFREAGLPVPAIYSEQLDEGLYLLEDLGNVMLFNRVHQQPFDEPLRHLYRQSLRRLIDMQLTGKTCIDFSVCYPRSAFDKASMMWDLNYFKYYFLKLVRVPFDEQALEDDFIRLTGYLLQEPGDYFLFRDFQSANIMVKEEQPFFIDYQGGRRGALQYDPASLLFDAKAHVPRKDRNELIRFYTDTLTEKIPVKQTAFLEAYQGFVLIRLMQAMGAFGFRGIVEKKPGFMESIPPALVLFAELLDEWVIPVHLPELTACFQRMVQSAYLRQLLLDAGIINKES